MTATATHLAETERPAHRHTGVALGVIACAQLMVVLDATIVNIALPHIQTALDFSRTGLSWVLNAYTLVFGGLLLLGGRMGDLFGRRRMFMIGVSLFAGASLAGGFAQDQAWLLATRALQGVGGAIASPTALALVTTTFEEGPARNRAFGVYAAVSGAGAAIGLILGGVLTDALSWRFVLFVNAPIGLALALVAPYVLAESKRATGRLDLPGAVTATSGMAALVYGFIHAATYGWSTWLTIGSFAAAVVLLGAFVVIEWRSAEPLMPLRLFRSQPRVGSYVVMLVTGAAVFAMFYFLTQYVQEIEGFSPLKAGFAFLPVSAVIVIVAQVASRLIARIGPRPLISLGVVLVGGGLLWSSDLGVHSSYLFHLLPAILVIGAGMGFVFVPITLTAVSGVAANDSGIASAMLNVGQQVGGTIGLAALVTVFGTAFRDSFSSQVARLAARAHLANPSAAGKSSLPAGTRHAIEQQAFTHGADMAFLTGALLAVGALVAAVALVRVPKGTTPSAPSTVGGG